MTPTFPAQPPQGSAPKRLQVAYVVSMAAGLHSFVFREIRELYALGVTVRLFPTQVGSGPYMPLSTWPIHQPTPREFFRAHVRILRQRFRPYLMSLREAVRFGVLADFALGAFFAAQVERFGVQLVHSHFGDHKLFIGYFVEKLTGRPLTVTIHAYELYNNPNPRLFLRALAATTAIVTVAGHNRAVLSEKWAVPPNRVAVIPLFADVPDVAPPSRDLRGKQVILTVARFVEKKGHRTLFKALARLPQDWEAWLVGNGSLDIRTLAKAFGVAERIRVLGRVTDEQLEDAYRSATVFCLPSERSETGDQEGIPVALMEAMAHGLPVIATRHAGIPELVEENLIEEGDAEGLAATLRRLGSDTRLRIEQGNRNRETVRARFSKRNVSSLKNLFQRVVEESRGEIRRQED